MPEPDKPLSPQEIHRGMVAELFRMRKVVAEAEALRPKIKRAERFIRELSAIWNIPLPQDLMPKEPVPVPTRPRPEGIAVVDDLTCPEPNCARNFETKQGFAVHRSRASCEIAGPGHGKSCPNHRGQW